MMREIILNYWNSFADLLRPYHDVINTISTFIVVVFTVVLARVAWKQNRDSKILQRDYLNVEFDGIRNNLGGELLGHVTFVNVGHLPAKKFSWLVNLSTGDGVWKPPKIKNKELVGKLIPIGAKWPMVSAGIPHPQEPPEGLHLYVWGRATYKDGYKWRKRYTNFCHRYPWEKRETPTGGGVSISAEHARFTTRVIARRKALTSLIAGYFVAQEWPKRFG